MAEVKAPKTKIITLDGGPKDGALLMARADGAMCLAVKVGSNIVLRPAGDLTVPAKAQAATFEDALRAFVDGHAKNDEGASPELLQERFVAAHDGPLPKDEPEPTPEPALAPVVPTP